MPSPFTNFMCLLNVMLIIKRFGFHDVLCSHHQRSLVRVVHPHLHRSRTRSKLSARPNRCSTSVNFSSTDGVELYCQRNEPQKLLVNVCNLQKEPSIYLSNVRLVQKLQQLHLVRRKVQRRNKLLLFLWRQHLLVK